ncbi:MAG: hypothetical protein ACREHD_26210, partial [Pirellulales bacterium]
VQASQAGGVITCRCGARLDVPPLSRLRAAAGEEPVPLSTVDRIRAMIHGDELPFGGSCSCCGRPANEVLFLRVECERITRDDASPGRWLWAAMVFGLAAPLIAMRSGRRHEELGRDISVDVPVAVTPECRSRISRMHSQRKLRRLLNQTPIYRQLLKEFPRAIITPLTTG